MLGIPQDSAGRVRHRAAQRRYRQRQRAKMTETDQRFATLEKQLQEMRVKEVLCRAASSLPLRLQTPPASHSCKT